MSKHFNVAVDPYDGGMTICQGCKAQGSFTQLPDGDCPTPYKPNSVLLKEALAREQALQLLLNAADQRIDELTVPDGYCVMPARLTAENGAKGLLIGEFQLRVTQDCPECAELEEPSEFCNICDGEGEYGQHHTIPWDQIKFIYSKAVGGLSIKAPPRHSTPVAVVPEGFMLVERSIWTEEQVEAATKCITMLKNVPGMTDRDLALAAMDAGQCKAPEITLADLASLEAAALNIPQ